MLIADIIPYERNARHNEKAIPKVAESIKEFGLRGTIGLESRENPVIVFGHTRVAACKSLGWTEIPDSKIEYCDDLTPEQVKAFRIADNKTGDIATYNKSMLREEVRSLKDMDMSRFGLDFKSKNLPYGAERLRTDGAYNLGICSRADCGRDGFPKLPKADAKPNELQGFNYAKSTPSDQKRGKGCHFFIDDYQFERLWNSPSAYLGVLRGHDCVLTPDFSLYMDMPDPMQEWNRYRSADARLVLGAARDNRRAHALMGTAVQLPLLLQGHPQALDRGDLDRRRCKGQGRAESVARRHAGSNAALGAVPSAPLRQEHQIRLRGLRGRGVQGGRISWAVEARRVE